MISLIICSIDAGKLARTREMYARALAGEAHELIAIPDAKSLAEGYNRAVAAAKGDPLIFSHDDVEILSPEFPARLKRHIQRFDLVGVAGTTRLVRANWAAAGPPYIFGQIAHPLPDGMIVVDVYGAPRPAVGNIQALDGLFMAARRSVLDLVRFDDQTFDGFHIYDVDFSFQAHRAGLRVGVACDINLLHHSFGKFDEEWTRYAEKFARKWDGALSPKEESPFQWGAATVSSREAALEVMTPWHWRTS